jgi:arylsulfatase A-like enzyme
MQAWRSARVRRGRIPTRNLALLALALACQPAGDEATGNDSAPESPPHIVLITVESLRPDHVGFQGGPRDTTPHLDRLAAESVVYEDAHSVTSWTLSAHASLFTGLYPDAHQTVRPLDRLGDAYRTLAEELSDAGYDTAGVVSGPYLRRAHNLNQGFARWNEAAASQEHQDAHGDVTNPTMLEGLERALSERDPERPLFLFAYFWDPHYDYVPPAPYDSMFVGPDDVPVPMQGYGRDGRVHAGSPPQALSYVLSQYDGEIRWTDETLGAFFAKLREAGLWDDTLLIVTADHGEEFFEHGWKGHKNNLFAESVHVPLLVKHPGSRRRGRDDRLVSLVDVFPTTLEIAGIESAGEVQGNSLLDPEPDPGRAIFFALRTLWYLQRPDGGEERVRDNEWHAVRQGDFKLVGVPGHRMFLFDVKRDPGEQRDLLEDGEQRDLLEDGEQMDLLEDGEQMDLLEDGDDFQARADRLTATLERHRADAEAWRGRLAAGGTAPLEESDLERLRSLGYVK